MAAEVRFGARAAGAAVQRSLPGALATAQRAATQTKVAAGQAANRASSALEQHAPGLQAEVGQDLRHAAAQAHQVATAGGAVASSLASQARNKAMAVPEVRQAVAAAQPRVEAARQTLAQAAAKAKAAAQQKLQEVKQQQQHERAKSRGMFDPDESAEEEE
jgi:hypothetical protein